MNPTMAIVPSSTVLSMDKQPMRVDREVTTLLWPREIVDAGQEAF